MPSHPTAFPPCNRLTLASTSAVVIGLLSNRASVSCSEGMDAISSSVGSVSCSSLFCTHSCIRWSNRESSTLCSANRDHHSNQRLRIAEGPYCNEPDASRTMFGTDAGGWLSDPNRLSARQNSRIRSGLSDLTFSNASISACRTCFRMCCLIFLSSILTRC